MDGHGQMPDGMQQPEGLMISLVYVGPCLSSLKTFFSHGRTWANTFLPHTTQTFSLTATQ